MNCPVCKNTCYPISAETAMGVKFTLKQCGNCRGVWFDPLEIESLPYHEVVRLAKIAVVKHSSSDVLSSLKNEIRCPVDNHLLHPLHGETAPRNIQMMQCPKCKGIWASIKALQHLYTSIEEEGKPGDADELIFPIFSSSILPFMVSAFLCLSTLMTIIVLRNHQEQRINATQLISGLTDIPLSPESQLIRFQTRSDVTSEISYGTSRLTMVKQTVDTSPSQTHQIILGNLSEGTGYVYQITLTDASGKSYTTPLYVFKTKP